MGVLCFKMGETGPWLNVCESLIALPYRGNDYAFNYIYFYSFYQNNTCTVFKKSNGSKTKKNNYNTPVLTYYLQYLLLRTTFDVFSYLFGICHCISK